ncbi:MAG TPA: ABC transporter ATP-binding protein, partial [Nakamurella sp.]
MSSISLVRPPPADTWAPLRRRWPLLAGTVAGLVLHQVAEALVPVLIGVVIDRAIAPGDVGALAAGLAALAGLFVVLTLSWRFGRIAGARAAEAAGFELRRDLVGRVLDPRGMRRTRRPGELVAIAGGDVDRTVGVVWVLAGAFAKGAAVATVAVSLLVISVPLGLAVLVATPVLLVGMHLVAGPLERRSGAEQESVAQAGAVAGDLLTGLRTLKGLGAEEAAIARFESANLESWRHARRAADLVGAYVGVSAALSGIFLAGLAWFAGSQAAAGQITVGELV